MYLGSGLQLFSLTVIEIDIRKTNLFSQCDTTNKTVIWKQTGHAVYKSLFLEPIASLISSVVCRQTSHEVRTHLCVQPMTYLTSLAVCKGTSHNVCTFLWLKPSSPLYTACVKTKEYQSMQSLRLKPMTPLTVLVGCEEKIKRFASVYV